MAYGTTAEVAAMLPKGNVAGDFTSTSKPKDTDVSAWLTRTSSRVDARIRGAGFDPTQLAGDGLNVVKDAVIRYVAGSVERDWAGAAGGNPDDHGRDLQAPLLELLGDLSSRPADTANMLGLAIPTTPSTVASSLRSYFTDEGDAKDTSVTPDRNFKVGGEF